MSLQRTIDTFQKNKSIQNNLGSIAVLLSNLNITKC